MQALAVCQAELLLGEPALGVDYHVIGAGALCWGDFIDPNLGPFVAKTGRKAGM